MRARYELIKKAIENGTLIITELYTPSNDFAGCIIEADGKKICSSNSVSDALIDASCDVPELYNYILDYIKWKKAIVEF